MAKTLLVWEMLRTVNVYEFWFGANRLLINGSHLLEEINRSYLWLMYAVDIHKMAPARDF